MNPDDAPKRPREKEAVFTTIVGGRPPGSGTQLGNIPRGIEVLIKKASVDPAFRELLLKNRAEAAKEIGLDLTDAERGMLSSIPEEQLRTIISNTKVKPEHRDLFSSTAGKLMVAAAAGVVLVGVMTPSFGHTLTPEQRERIFRDRMAPLSDTNDVNEPNKPDTDSNQAEPEQTNLNER